MLQSTAEGAVSATPPPFPPPLSVPPPMEPMSKTGVVVELVEENSGTYETDRDEEPLSALIQISPNCTVRSTKKLDPKPVIVITSGVMHVTASKAINMMTRTGMATVETLDVVVATAAATATTTAVSVPTGPLATTAATADSTASISGSSPSSSFSNSPGFGSVASSTADSDPSADPCTTSSSIAPPAETAAAAAAAATITPSPPPSSSSSSSSSFALFPALPAELRLRVWALAARTPRLIDIRYSRGAGRFWSPNAVPAVLHACAEARAEALRAYGLCCFGGGGGGGGGNADVGWGTWGPRAATRRSRRRRGRGASGGAGGGAEGGGGGAGGRTMARRSGSYEGSADGGSSRSRLRSGTGGAGGAVRSTAGDEVVRIYMLGAGSSGRKSRTGRRRRVERGRASDCDDDDDDDDDDDCGDYADDSCDCCDCYDEERVRAAGYGGAGGPAGRSGHGHEYNHRHGAPGSSGTQRSGSAHAGTWRATSRNANPGRRPTRPGTAAQGIASAPSSTSMSAPWQLGDCGQLGGSRDTLYFSLGAWSQLEQMKEFARWWRGMDWMV